MASFYRERNKLREVGICPTVSQPGSMNSISPGRWVWVICLGDTPVIFSQNQPEVGMGKGIKSYGLEGRKRCRSCGWLILNVEESGF